jgi:hypothetical protein
MKPTHGLPVAAWVVLCLGLVAALSIEIVLCAHFDTRAALALRSAKEIETKICRFGPLSADRESLQKRVAEFEDDSDEEPAEEGGDPLLSAKKRMELFNALSACGMDEKIAREKASALAGDGSMAAFVLNISATKGLNIRRLDNLKTDRANGWKIAVSCELSDLSKVIELIDSPPVGLKLDALSLVKETTGDVVAQSFFKINQTGGNL